MKLRVKRGTLYSAAVAVALIAVFFIARGGEKAATENQITGADIVCNSPYIRQGESCCIDSDANRICDSDESVTERSMAESPSEDLPPLNIKKVKINGNDALAGSLNTVECKPGETVKVEVKIEAEESRANIEVEVRISDYENRGLFSSEKITIPYLEKGLSYTPIIYPVLPEGAKDSNYRMEVLASTATAAGRKSAEYRLKGVAPVNLITFNSFKMKPETVNAGQSAEALVEMENIGQSEKMVRVAISIPYLNTGGFKVIENMGKWWHNTTSVSINIPTASPEDSDRCRWDGGIKYCTYMAKLRVGYDYDPATKNYRQVLPEKFAPIEVVFSG